MPGPLVIAHRGASGYRPEHTLEAYRLAVALGADAIEPDLVLTADGVPVARHENELSATTDVADRPEFTRRRTTRQVEGRTLTGWFAEDFTLAELRLLRARERFPLLRPHNQIYDDRFGVPTLAEILALARAESVRLGHTVAVHPELKLATHLARRGLRHDEILPDALRVAGPGLPVRIQSFEPWVLRRLARSTSLSLVQLVDAGGLPPGPERSADRRAYADMITPCGLREVSTYARTVGVHKSLLVARTPSGRLGEASGLAGHAADAALQVHAWTFRNENAFLPAEYRIGEHDAEYGAAVCEHAAFLGLGIDGLVTDHPDTAVAARAHHARSPEQLVRGGIAP